MGIIKIASHLVSQKLMNECNFFKYHVTLQNISLNLENLENLDLISELSHYIE